MWCALCNHVGVKSSRTSQREEMPYKTALTQQLARVLVYSYIGMGSCVQQHYRYLLVESVELLLYIRASVGVSTTFCYVTNRRSKTSRGTSRDGPNRKRAQQYEHASPSALSSCASRGVLHMSLLILVSCPHASLTREQNCNLRFNVAACSWTRFKASSERDVQAC